MVEEGEWSEYWTKAEKRYHTPQRTRRNTSGVDTPDVFLREIPAIIEKLH